jgi:hypothetical protein
LLIGAISVLAVPYLNHVVYPDSLPRNAQKGAIGYAVIPEDRQIDELGAADKIGTEADARAYVEALVKRWDPNETNPHVVEFEDRVAHAEYLAVHNPEKLIPESEIAKVFNQLMDEWQMPAWAHISVPQLHAFRITYAKSVYPKSVARSAESIAPSCRPTEALLLLHFLNSRGSVPPEMRGHGWRRSSPASENSQRHEYITYQQKYFARHPVSFERVVDDLFDRLGIH